MCAIAYKKIDQSPRPRPTRRRCLRTGGFAINVAAMTLTARDITCRRAGRSLFMPVGFTLPPGTALVLRGPNGAGKTTLLRALAGLFPMETGTLTLDGQPVADLDGAIAYTGHADAVKPALTVAENLDFWAQYHGVAETTSVARDFDLSALAPRLAGRLSAGQKRRLGLARIALSGVRVWLLDEPTVSLDTDTVARLEGIIRTHLARGGMAVIATHLPLDLPAEVLRLAASEDRTVQDAFLEGGFA